MENEVGNYKAKLSRIKERLKNYFIFIGETYIDDSSLIYDILVQHMVLTGTGSNITTKYRRIKNGRKFYLYLKENFLTKSHDQNKAQLSEKNIRETFNIE